MSTDPETVARRLIDEGFTGGNTAVCDELISPDLVEHQDFGPRHAPGAAGVRAVIESLHRAYAGFRLEIQHLAVEDDRVWLHLRGSGKHHGPFMGHAPTGRSMSIDVFDLLRVVDGKVVEHWGVPDRLGALLQLGALQPPA